jgi:glycosyltransferase involved in cell wall biosynthesis
MFRWAVGDGESGVHAEYYWRWAVGLGVFAGLTLVLLLALGAGLGLGVIDPLWAVLPVLGWLGAAARLRDPAILAGRAAAVAGFLAGVRRRPLVEARRWAQLRGVWFILSGVPIDDTGGGARATQVALELLRQGCFVVFISKFPRYESVDLGLRFAHPNLRTYRAADFDWDRFVGQYKALLEGKPLVALVEFPVADFLPIVDRVRGAGGRVIYDLIDDWATSLGGNWYRPEVERAFIDRADVLTATAPALADRLRELSGREVQLVPNAVNSRLFDPSRPYPRPEDMPGAEWVMIYAGALWGEWFDWELVIRLADAYPEAAVLVIGDYRGQCPERRPNLHFLGLKPQRELPAYLAHSDVAIIPWKVNKITLATSPLKVYEYLAMRRPVVAPDLPPLRGIPGVWLASCKDEFVHLVKYVRDVDYPVDQVTDFVQANNWEARVKVLSSLVGGT